MKMNIAFFMQVLKKKIINSYAIGGRVLNFVSVSDDFLQQE